MEAGAARKTLTLPRSLKPIEILDLVDLPTFEEPLTPEARSAISRYGALQDAAKAILERAEPVTLIGTGRYAVVFELRDGARMYALKVVRTGVLLMPHREGIVGAFLRHSDLPHERKARMAVPVRKSGVGKAADPFLHCVDYHGTLTMRERDFYEAVETNHVDNALNRGWSFAKAVFLSDKLKIEARDIVGDVVITVNVEELFFVRSEVFLLDLSVERFDLTVAYSELMFFQVGLSQIRLFEELALVQADLHHGNIFVKNACAGKDLRLVYASDVEGEFADILPEMSGWPPPFEGPGKMPMIPVFAVGDFGLSTMGGIGKDIIFTVVRSLEHDLHTLAISTIFSTCDAFMEFHRVLPSNTVVDSWIRLVNNLLRFLIKIDRMSPRKQNEYTTDFFPLAKLLLEGLEERNSMKTLDACANLKRIDRTRFRYFFDVDVNKESAGSSSRTPSQLEKMLSDMWDVNKMGGCVAGPEFISVEDPEWGTVPPELEKE